LKTSMRIVALGDSLTVGYMSPVTGLEWPPYQPYSSFLEEMIRDAIAKMRKDAKVEIINKGLNGDLTESMLSRFDGDVLQLKPSHVIILGGTNDLGWSIPVAEIYRNLEKMYDKAIHHSIRLIACAVPSILGYDSLIPPRVGLNRMIRSYAKGRERSTWTSSRQQRTPQPKGCHRTIQTTACTSAPKVIERSLKRSSKKLSSRS